MFEKHWYENKSYRESTSIQEAMRKKQMSFRDPSCHSSRSTKAKVYERGGVILGFEYPQPVVTLGRRGSESKDLMAPEILKERGISVFSTERGGLATLHSPGQLVIYPIFSLKSLGMGVKGYMNLLLRVSQLWMSSYGVSTDLYPEGLFTQRGKIVFMGVAVRQGISSHGLAINISNDLDLFSLIRCCGIEQRPIDSVYQWTQVKFPLEALFYHWCDLFFQEVRVIPNTVGLSS